MNKIKVLIFFLVLFNVFIGRAEEIQVISKLVSENGKTYVKVNDVPFPFFGAQIRLDALLNCDKLTINQVEAYFIKATELGINCVQIPIYWKLIESKQDVFTFEVVDRILEFANKYNMKIEVLWFSTNMCGDSFSYLVPSYVLYPAEKRFLRNNEGSFWNYYGFQYSLILDDEWILERETNAVKRLMDHIGDWDKANGLHHPVIAAQIHNEPDGFARWRFNQFNIRYRDGHPFTKEDAWDMTLHALNAVGNAVKESKYRVLTRTNIITKDGLRNFPEVDGANPVDVFHLDGIDFVSYDPYVNSLDMIKSNTMDFTSIEGNYALIAENKGTYENTASLILTAAALGSGYNIYDLATSKFFIDNTSPDFRDQIDHGIYTWDLKDKNHTASVKSILRGLTAAAPDVARTPPVDFAAFNITSQYPQQIKTQTINSTRITVSFSTTKGALGFALTCEEYLLLYATDEAIFDLSNGIFNDVIKGRYNQEGNFQVTGDAQLLDGHLLHAEKEVLYKINFTSNKTLASTTIQNIGTVVNDEANEVLILNFEDEDETNEIIAHLHTHDWQTNPAYTRDLFTLNSNKTGVNQTARCASFSGYYSNNEWWYGLDIVLKKPVILTPEMKFVHAAIMTNRTDSDLNRGLILLNSSGGSIVENWQSVSSEWRDYVFPIPETATEIKEFRFMFNHQKAGQITYLDEIIISNDPKPRSLITGTLNIVKEKTLTAYVIGKNINIFTPLTKSTINIYDVMGKKIFSEFTDGKKKSILVKTPGVYLIVCDSEMIKVIVS